jgi:hypothetical protein
MRVSKGLQLIGKGSSVGFGFRLFVLTVMDTKLQSFLKNLVTNKALWPQYVQALEIVLSVNGVKATLPKGNAVNPGLPVVAKNLRISKWFDPKTNTFAFWARLDVPVGAALPTPALFEPRVTDGFRRGTSQDVQTAFDLGQSFNTPMKLEIWAPIAPPKAAPVQAAKPKPITPKPSDPVTVINPPRDSSYQIYDENGMPSGVGASVTYTREGFEALQREVLRSRSGAGLYPPTSKRPAAQVAKEVASSPTNYAYLAAAGIGVWFLFSVG